MRPPFLVYRKWEVQMGGAELSDSSLVQQGNSPPYHVYYSENIFSVHQSDSGTV